MREAQQAPIECYVSLVKMASYGYSSDRVLHIKFSSGQTSLPADRAVLSVFSSCARNCPDDATEWDLSGLLLEGQHVQRSTVVAWLNLAYTATLGAPFEEVPQQEDPSKTLTGLVQLLGFADALGSSRGLLLSLDARVFESPGAIGRDLCDAGK